MSGAAADDETKLLDHLCAAVAREVPAMLQQAASFTARDESQSCAEAARLMSRLWQQAMRDGPSLLGIAQQPLGEVGALYSSPGLFIRSCDRFHHAWLYLLREHVFSLYGQQPNRCRDVIDLIQSLAQALLGRIAEPLCGDALPWPHLQLLSRIDARLGSSRAEADSWCALIIVRLRAPMLHESANDIDGRQSRIDTALVRVTQLLKPADVAGQLDRSTIALLIGALPGPDTARIAAESLARRLAGADERGLGAFGAVFGVSLAAAEEADVGKMLARAEKAAERAAQSGLRVQFHRESGDDDVIDGTRLVPLLVDALENNELRLFLQPKANLGTGAVTGAEALLRWTPPNRRPMRPDHLVILALNAGLLPQLSRYVLNGALRILAGLLHEQVEIDLSINLTAHDLADPDFPDDVGAALSLWRVPPERVTLELTESAMVEDASSAIEAMARLRALGVKLSIDDFGTGYSSLTWLRQMPLNELKIDKSFISPMDEDPNSEQVVATILSLARHFGLHTVAEGVETIEACERLERMGCDTIQGYLLGKPMPPTDFVEWYRACGGHFLPTAPERCAS